jgi:hypothetical protein
MNKITTISTLIKLYYDVCDNYEDYMPKEITPTEISIYRANIVNTIYILINNKMPLGSDTFTLLRLLNNDITGKRLTPEQVIARFKIKA